MTVLYPKAMRSCSESCFEEEETARFGFWDMAVLQVADGSGWGLKSGQEACAITQVRGDEGLAAAKTRGWGAAEGELSESRTGLAVGEGGGGERRRSDGMDGGTVS